MELHELGLSVRAFNAVCRAEIRSVPELYNMYQCNSEKLRLLIGNKHFEEVGDALAKHREAVWEENRKADESATAPNPSVIVSESYTRAVTLTRSIIANAQAAQQSLYEVCKGLKEMRDGKLYKELGYQNFEDYTENEVGILRHQAYKYATIAEMENVDSSQHFDRIGVTKLYLLAKLDEPTRQEITEAVDIEAVTVKDLKAQIESLRNAKEKAEKKLSVMTEDRDRKEAARQKCFDRFKEIAAEKRELQAQIDELKSSPQQVSVEDVSRIEELEAALAAKQKKLDERPIQEAFTDGWSQQRRGKFTALCESLDAQLGTVLAFLEANDQCSDFGWFAQNIKNKLRSWNTKINELLSEDQKEET